MADQIGKVFGGIVSGFSEYGLYVRENDSLAEGMVRLRDLRDDYYEFDKETYSMVGRKTKKRISLGDKIKIKVTNANVERKLIDYVIIP